MYNWILIASKEGVAKENEDIIKTHWTSLNERKLLHVYKQQIIQWQSTVNEWIAIERHALIPAGALNEKKLACYKLGKCFLRTKIERKSTSKDVQDDDDDVDEEEEDNKTRKSLKWWMTKRSQLKRILSKKETT